MDYKTATDELIQGVTLIDLAAELGLAPNTIRTARLEEGTATYRKPPKGWERAVAALARKRAAALLLLAAGLEASESSAVT